MNRYSPNLKPPALHNHHDKAHHLGVPRSNVIDLRQVHTSTSAPVQAAPKVSWWQRQRQRRQLPSIQSHTPPPPVPAKGIRSPLWPIVKPLAGFTMICILLVAPLAALGMYQRVNAVRDAVLTTSQEAVNNLRQGTQAASLADFTGAAESFTSASTDFRTAHDQLTSVDATLTPILRILPAAGDQFVSAENILIAGEQIAAAGHDVTTAIELLSQLPLPQVNTDSSQQLTLTDLLVVAHSALRPAIPRLQRATVALQAVDLSTVPADYQANIQLAKDKMPIVSQSINQLLTLTETMLTILGHDQAKRYLVLFQNNRELRPTGGFIGSFAVVDIRQGAVQRLNIPGGGPYDLLGSLKTHVISPTPLHYVNPHWQMQDANWWPDFPTSAEKVQWFYRKSGGSTVDGVITFTPDVIEKMLALTGPIEMPEYDVIVTAENFYDITQVQAERKFDDTKESKKFIADLTPRLLNNLFDGRVENFLPVLQIFYSALSQKDMLVYFNDEFLQSEMAALGWTGAVRSASKDYLMVVDTNINGGKTDGVIDETIQHQAAIQADGSIIDTVEIIRVHRGSSNDQFANVNNWDYLRTYVPAGSRLLRAEGFTQPDPKLEFDPAADYQPDIDLTDISGDTIIDEASHTRINTEFDKTVFGNWIETRPGETSRVVLEYQLPFQLQLNGLFQPVDSYSLLIQKQPGSFDPLVITSVIYPENYQMRWAYPAATSGTIHSALWHDAYLGIVFEQR